MTPTTRVGTVSIHDPRADAIDHRAYRAYGGQGLQAHLAIGDVTVIVGGSAATPETLRAEAQALRAIAAHAEALADRLAVHEAEITSTSAHLGEHEQVAS